MGGAEEGAVRQRNACISISYSIFYFINVCDRVYRNKFPLKKGVLIIDISVTCKLKQCILMLKIVIIHYCISVNVAEVPSIVRKCSLKIVLIIIVHTFDYLPWYMFFIAACCYYAMMEVDNFTYFYRKYGDHYIFAYFTYDTYIQYK